MSTHFVPSLEMMSRNIDVLGGLINVCLNVLSAHIYTDRHHLDTVVKRLTHTPMVRHFISMCLCCFDFVF